MSDGNRLAALRERIERLSTYYYNSPQQQGIDRKTKQFVVDRCVPHIRGPRVLDLGFVDRMWPDAVLALGHSVDIVEGASAHAAKARAEYAGEPRARVTHALFEEFTPDTTYNTIICGDILRFLEDPAAWLAGARAWLAPGGRLRLAVGG